MNFKKISLYLFLSGLVSFSYASSFQVWEQDGAGVGLYHAGYAAGAIDASTVFYNPAGIAFLKRPQLSLDAVVIHSGFIFDGQVMRTVGFFPTESKPVAANGGFTKLVPGFHIAAPLNEKWGVGFSVAVPFGLAVDYGTAEFLRYSTVKTAARVINATPAISYNLTPETSLGVGLDLQHMNAEFIQIVGIPPAPELDTQSDNTLSSNGVGMHAGIMHQLNAQTRIGLSYHSQVRHKLTGKSIFSGPLAAPIPDPDAPGVVEGNSVQAEINLPAYTAAGVHHQLTDRIAVMANVIYTQWSSINAITLQDVVAVNLEGEQITVTASLPKAYRNTFNVSLGGEYAFNEQLTLRLGVGYDQTPERTELRDLHMPDNNRFVTAIGANYKINSCWSVDAGWSHFFLKRSHINSPPLDVGIVSTQQVGNVKGAADAVALQVNWAFA